MLLKEARRKVYQAREKYKTELDSKLSNYRNEVCVSVYLVLSGVDEISSTPGTIHAYLKL